MIPVIKAHSVEEVVGVLIMVALAVVEIAVLSEGVAVVVEKDPWMVDLRVVVAELDSVDVETVGVATAVNDFPANIHTK